MKTEKTENVVIRIPHGVIPNQKVPIYCLGLPEDVAELERILNKVDISKVPK